MVTNWHFDYMCLAMRQTLGFNWTEMFETIVCDAKYPLFVKADTAFRQYDYEKKNYQGKCSKNLKTGKFFFNGNAKSLTEFFKD